MTDKEIVPVGSGDLITFDDEKVSLIKRTIAKDATDDELALFLHQAQKTGLDPLAKQIYFQKYNTRGGPQIAIITGIDGYRLVASRTGVYAGNDAPVFDGRINYAGRDVPAKATVTVWRIVGGRRMPFAASVYWDEYCPDPPRDYQWKKMPHVMLAKCAEAAALRKAFPADLSGVYTHEEMQQADFVVIDAPSVEIEQPEIKIKLGYTDPEPTEQVASSRKPTPAQQKPASKTQAPSPANVGGPSRDAEAVKAALIAASMSGSASQAGEKQLKFTRASLSSLTGDNHADAGAIIRYVFGIDSSSKLTGGQASALIDWAGANKDNGYEVNPTSVIEARGIVNAQLVIDGQRSLFDDEPNGAYQE